VVYYAELGYTVQQQVELPEAVVIVQALAEVAVDLGVVEEVGVVEAVVEVLFVVVEV